MSGPDDLGGRRKRNELDDPGGRHTMDGPDDQDDRRKMGELDDQDDRRRMGGLDDPDGRQTMDGTYVLGGHWNRTIPDAVRGRIWWAAQNRRKIFSDL